MICQMGTTEMWSAISQARARVSDELVAADETVADEGFTGWDRLLQAILEDSSARIPAQLRRHGIDVLTDALLTLELREASVLTLRYGIGFDEQPELVYAPHDVSAQLAVSDWQVASLECAGLAALRAILHPTAPARGASSVAR